MMKMKKSIRIRLLHVLVAFLMVSVSAFAAKPLATFDEVVEAIAVSPVDPKCMYALAGEMFHASFDGGKTWKAKSTPMLLNGDRMLVADAGNSLTVYILCGNQVSRYCPGKIFKTTNAGESWEQIARQVPDLQITSFVQNQSQPKVFFLADGSGHIYTSRDGGATWLTLEVSRFRDMQITTIATFRKDLKTIYVVGVPWGSPCPCGEVFRSKDGGASWVKLVPVFEAGTGYELIPGIIRLHFSQDDSKTFWGTEAYLAIQTTDGGDQWKEIQKGLEERVNARMNVYLEPGNPGVIYTFAEKIWKGSNGGAAWEVALDPGIPLSNMLVWKPGKQKMFFYSSGKMIYTAPLPN